MDRNKTTESSAELYSDEGVIRIISLDDTTNGSANAQNTADGTPEMQNQHSEDDNMDADASSSSSSEELDEDIGFLQAKTEADAVIPACKDEAFVITCFEDRWLVVGGKDEQALLYNLQDSLSEPVLKIDEHKDSVVCAQFSAKGHLLATGDMKGLIVVSSTAELKKCYTVDDCEELSWIQWHSSADILLAGGKNGIWMWLLTLDGVQQTKVYLCDSPAGSIDGKLLPDGKRLLSCYEDGAVKLWSLKDEKSTSIVTGAESATCLDVHHSLPVAVIGDLMGRCYFVSTETMKVLLVFPAHKGPADSEAAVECVNFCAGEEPWFVAGTSTGYVGIFDFKAGITRYYVKESSDPVVACRWYSTDSKELYVVTAGFSGTVRIYNSRSGVPFLALISKSIAEQDSHLLSMDLDLKGPVLYTAYSSGQLCKFSLVNL